MDGMIKKNNFIDFLRQYRIDVDELKQERLDITFENVDNRELYSLKQLIEYTNMLAANLNYSIFDPSQKQFHDLMIDLMSTLIKSRFT